MRGMTTFCLMMSLCFVAGALAQPPDVGGGSDDDETEALYLARYCVNEAGFNSPRDCGAMAQVLRNTSREDESLLDAMHRHTGGRLFVVGGPGRNGQTQRSWTRGLHLGEEAPHGWPRDLDWAGEYRQRFARVYGLSLRIVRGEMGRGPCRGFPIAWGGAMDDHVAIRRGLVRVDCGDTVQRYWERP